MPRREREEKEEVMRARQRLICSESNSLVKVLTPLSLERRLPPRVVAHFLADLYLTVSMCVVQKFKALSNIVPSLLAS